MIGDIAMEADETLSVTITAAGVTIGLAGESTGTIGDDDSVASFRQHYAQLAFNVVGDYLPVVGDFDGNGTIGHRTCCTQPAATDYLWNIGRRGLPTRTQRVVKVWAPTSRSSPTSIATVSTTSSVRAMASARRLRLAHAGRASSPSGSTSAALTGPAIIEERPRDHVLVRPGHELVTARGLEYVNAVVHCVSATGAWHLHLPCGDPRPRPARDPLRTHGTALDYVWSELVCRARAPDPRVPHGTRSRRSSPGSADVRRGAAWLRRSVTPSRQPSIGRSRTPIATATSTHDDRLDADELVQRPGAAARGGILDCWCAVIGGASGPASSSTRLEPRADSRADRVRVIATDQPSTSSPRLRGPGSGPSARPHR